MAETTAVDSKNISSCHRISDGFEFSHLTTLLKLTLSRFTYAGKIILSACFTASDFLHLVKAVCSESFKNFMPRHLLANIVF